MKAQRPKNNHAEPLVWAMRNSCGVAQHLFHVANSELRHTILGERQPKIMSDFLIRGSLAQIDPAIAQLIQHEHAHQFAKLMMIASESTAPAAVREAEGSILQNLYAEGYPHADYHGLNESELLDYGYNLAQFRRYADRRYYRGAEYNNILESLCQRRGAEAFCPAGMTPDQLFLNVQPLSGANANTAVYEALIERGSTVMGLNLLHGGHLTHGSPVNHSGKHYNIAFYGVDEKTERLDYDEIRAIALREKPKMIIAGFTSYPLAPDFAKFRAIADEVGALLLADISHTAGMAIAGEYPNPVGIAHITTFTTHKTLLGPRGAVIITTDPELAKKIDRAVFPGMQGGPHMNKVAGIATAFKLSMTPQFKAFQKQVAQNAVALAHGFTQSGVRVVHGGTNTHMVLVDTKSICQENGVPLMGDVSARIVDMMNVVCNRNTIPGDKDATKPSALRLGTTWVTQRGLVEADMHEIAYAISDTLKTARPFTLSTAKGALQYRAKVNFDALVAGAARISALCAKAGVDVPVASDSYPHVWDKVELPTTNSQPLSALEITGKNGDARAFMHTVFTSDVAALQNEETQPSWILERDGKPMSPAIVLALPNSFRVAVPPANLPRVARWLRALSDGYVISDDADLQAKVPGPVVVTQVPSDGFDATHLPAKMDGASVASDKPYFVGKK